MCPGMRIGRNRQFPCYLRAGEPQRFAEAANGIQHMPLDDFGDAFVDDQAVTFLAATAVITNLALRRDERR